MSHLPKFKKEVAVELKVGMIGNARRLAAEIVKVDIESLTVVFWVTHVRRMLGHPPSDRVRIPHADFMALPKRMQPKELR